MVSRRPSPVAPSRKQLALKCVDGQPLTRSDLQYDLLCHIFNNTQDVFTDPSTASGEEKRKITFKELYLSGIMNSVKANKALKDRMQESDLFKEDFGMLALLVNVGRVSPTMSFFPEMKTAIRTYHPLPALQRAQGNLQDAPRIKLILKAALLGGGLDPEVAPSTPANIITRVKAGHIPPTTMMNLVFVLANHSSSVGQSYLQDGIDFNDLFARDDISSASRARAFLWLCYHYLEAPAESDEYDDDQPANPFGDSRRDNRPTFVFLSDEEIAGENVDTDEEKELAERLISQRADALINQEAKREAKEAKAQSKMVNSQKGDVEEAELPQEAPKQKGKRGPKAKDTKEKNTTTRRKKGDQQAPVMTNPVPRFNMEEGNESTNISVIPSPPALLEGKQRHHDSSDRLSHGGNNIAELRQLNRNKHRYMPYQPNPIHKQRQSDGHYFPSITPRSMLHQAWHIVTTTDPLYDSEGEAGDEYMRHDYMKRLEVVDMLRDAQFVCP